MYKCTLYTSYVLYMYSLHIWGFLSRWTGGLAKKQTSVDGYIHTCPTLWNLWDSGGGIFTSNTSLHSTSWWPFNAWITFFFNLRTCFCVNSLLICQLADDISSQARMYFTIWPHANGNSKPKTFRLPKVYLPTLYSVNWTNHLMVAFTGHPRLMVFYSMFRFLLVFGWSFLSASCKRYDMLLWLFYDLRRLDANLHVIEYFTSALFL
jgi:hypothetical protein